jgi:2-polyprenyl-3-methyl-5-hydroxy-6-metoxy-1,4-benzoquinol methylase
MTPLRPTEPTTPLRLGNIPLVEKTGWILSKVTGKRVLHAGPTDSPTTAEKAESKQLLHQHLQERCLQLVGVDLAREAIEFLRINHGITDILEGNVEELDTVVPSGHFDLVLAGDVIEHLNNIGHFFQSAQRVLKPGGELLITVPNAFAIKRMLGAVFLRQERNHPDHMVYLSLMNLQQAAWRFDYAITEVAGFMFESPNDQTNRRANRAVRTILSLTGNNYLADELAVIMVKCTR